MPQQPQGLVQVTGVVQGSESPSSFVPDNDAAAGSFFWMDVPGLVSSLWLSENVLLARVLMVQVALGTPPCTQLVGKLCCRCFSSMSVADCAARLNAGPSLLVLCNHQGSPVQLATLVPQQPSRGHLTQQAVGLLRAGHVLPPAAQLTHSQLRLPMPCCCP